MARGPNQFAIALCEALGIDSAKVCSMDFHLRAGTRDEISISFAPSTVEEAKLKEVKMFKLVEIDDGD